MMRFAFYIVFLGGTLMGLRTGMDSLARLAPFAQAHSPAARLEQQELLRAQQAKLDLGLQAMNNESLIDTAKLRGIASIEK